MSYRTAATLSDRHGQQGTRAVTMKNTSAFRPLAWAARNCVWAATLGLGVALAGCMPSGGQRLATGVAGERTANSAEPMTEAYRAMSAEDRVLHNLDNSLWTSDGKPSARHLYVLYAPWCPASKQLFMSTRDMPDDVEIRWLPVGGGPDEASRNRVDLLARSRSLGNLERALAKGSLSAPARGSESVVSYQETAMSAVSDLVKAKPRVVVKGAGAVSKPVTETTTLGYPTIVWMGDDGLHIRSGAPSRADFLSIVKGIKPRPAAQDVEPLGKDLIGQSVRLDLARSAGVYFAERGSRVDLRSRPDQAAPWAGFLDGGTYMTIKGVVRGTDWMMLTSASGKDQYFVHDPSIARAAMLQYHVKPIPGNRSAYAKRDVPVLSHPFADARQVETLRRGEGYDADGLLEVGGETWVSLPILTKGQPAFVRAADVQIQ